jgi:hypothetical protein
MLWIDILKNWQGRITLKYPKQLKGRFMWNTSVLMNNGNSEFKQSFKSNKFLPTIQNKKDFQEYIDKSDNKYAVVFPNLSKDTMLVIPMPVNGKNFATLKDFIDNSSEIHQIEFWKKEAEVAIISMYKYDNV